MKQEILQFIKENDVKFVRLAFCDITGVHKNISLMASEFERALTEGISFDASSVPGFADISRSDLFLHPQIDTVNTLPWRPSQGRVVRFYCDIADPEGNPFEFDSRAVLKKAAARAQALGFYPKIGTEFEFYLCLTDERANPLMEPHDEGGCFDIAPLDKGENVRREICLALEEMGLYPENSHHECGRGQNEIDFKYGDALEAADHFLTFKSAVKNIAARNGLFASFMPKPFKDMSGSGLHVNISLNKNGKNLFRSADSGHSEEAESFIAGVLKRAREMSAFLNASVNSYERLGAFGAPKYVGWSHRNRSSLIRIPAAKGENVRMELRNPDAVMNPYLGFALIISAGLDGIEKKLKLKKSVNGNLYTADKSVLDKLDPLPGSLCEAVEIAKKSRFVQKVIGKGLLKKYLELKNAEIASYEVAEDKEEYKFVNYFKNM